MTAIVIIPVVAKATPVQAASSPYHIYQVTPAEQVILKDRALHLQHAILTKQQPYEASFPASMLAKYSKRVLWYMVLHTMYYSVPFVEGIYRASQFTLGSYETATGCGFAFSQHLTDSQMHQTEVNASNLVSDLRNKPMSTTDKIKEVYNRQQKWMSFDTQFAQKDASGNVTHINDLSETAYGALVSHKAVCCGAAMAFSLLCYYAGIPDVTMIYGYLTGPGVDHGGHAWNTYTDGKKTYMIDIVNFHCLEETIKDCDYEPNAINSTTFRYTF